MNTHGPSSPAMQAYRMYTERFGDGGTDGLSFGQCVELYMNCGFVVSTPEFFIAARMCPKEAPYEEIVNAAYPFQPEACNAWFICLMAGDPRLCWTYYPYEMEYVGYQRVADEPIRWFNMNQYRRLLAMGSKPKVPDPEPIPPPPTTDNKDAKAAIRQAQINRADRRGNQSTILSDAVGNPASTPGKTILS